MALDPYSRVFRPDVQASPELPQWLPMGESEQGEQFTQASGTFADLLKKRMAMGKGAEGAGSSVGSAMGAGMSSGASAGGGGMQSL